jgi:hypothetical protein
MGIFSKFEHQAASALKTVVMDAKKLVDVALADITDLENKLAIAKRRAVDLAAEAQKIAEDSATKAQEIADTLAAEALAAKNKAITLASQIPSVDPILGPAALTESVEQPAGSTSDPILIPAQITVLNQGK